MKKFKSLPYAPIFMLSALLACAIAFGDVVVSSSVGTANAESTQTSESTTCEGQAWPHYTAECLASLTSGDDAQDTAPKTVKIAY